VSLPGSGDDRLCNYRGIITIMGRPPCCSKEGLNRRAWTAKEDMILSDYTRIHGDCGWASLPQKAGESQKISINKEVNLY